MKKDSKPFEINPKYLLYAGASIILFIPFLLTRKAILEEVNFSNTGQIGDTIGGITAPFLSLIGSILVYYALKAQIDANKIIQEQIKDDKIAKQQELESQNLSLLFQYIQNTIEQFEINIVEARFKGTASQNIITFKGYDAFANLWNTFGNIEYGKNKYTELNSILRLMISLRTKINQSNATNKNILAELLDYQFSEIIMSGLQEYSSDPDYYERYFLKRFGALGSGIPTTTNIRTSIINYINLMN